MNQQATFQGNHGAAKRRVDRLTDRMIAMGAVAYVQEAFAGERHV